MFERKFNNFYSFHTQIYILEMNKSVSNFVLYCILTLGIRTLCTTIDAVRAFEQHQSTQYV